MERPAQEKIEEILRGLRSLVEQAVREEQLIDRLTKLGNNEALNTWIQNNLDEGRPFWLAFIEVDRFKSINDTFGYHAADELLRHIAAQLRNGAENYFEGLTVPFRAHGDEFYMGGVGEAAGVKQALDLVRTNIAALRVRSPEQDRGQNQGPMRCTVSIGWATREDAHSATDQELDLRGLHGILEVAMAEAKVERDQMVRYSQDLKKPKLQSDRADCKRCRAKFDLRVPTANLREAPLHCPNCGEQIHRPISLRPQPL